MILFGKWARTLADNWIWVVACSYSIAPDDLKTRLARLGHSLGVVFRGVIVANKQGLSASVDRDWAIVKGSNATHDFSAYAEGLGHLVASQPAAPSEVVFLNDSLFESHHPASNLRAVLHHLPLVRQIKVPAISGKTDRYSTVCHCNPWSGLTIYVSTYCFALNRAAFPMLIGLQSLADVDGLTDDRPIESPEWGNGMRPNFREFLRAFVGYAHTSFKWPGLDRYAVRDQLVSVKARCIYLEHRLSGEIGRDGCIVPVNARRVDRLRLYFAEKVAGLLNALRVR